MAGHVYIYMAGYMVGAIYYMAGAIYDEASTIHYSTNVNQLPAGQIKNFRFLS